MEQLKHQLNQNGIDSSQVDFSVCTVSTVIDDECQQGSAARTLPNSSSNTSLINSNTGIHDYIHVTTASGPQSFSTGHPSLFPREINIKVLYIKVYTQLLIIIQCNLAKKVISVHIY